MKNLSKSLVLLGAIAWLGAMPAIGQIQWSVDEFGVATLNQNPWQPGQLLPDPTGGYVAGPVLVYNLPYAGLPGDVLLHDGGLAGPFLDVIRFDGNGHLIFYSDNTDGADSPADTQSPPNPLLPNQVNLLENGVEGGFQDAFYVPTPGQPGWDPSNPSYQFISDYAAPEPATFALVGLGGLGVLIAARRRK